METTVTKKTPRRVRMPISKQPLPNYTRREERLNAVSHGIGILFGIAVIICGMMRVGGRHDLPTTAAVLIYGLSMTILYAVSTIYHGLPVGFPKRVMRAVDHCTIYLLIAGTYTPILICAIAPKYPGLAWGIFAIEWGLAIFASVFTAIDHLYYRVLSMCCYIGMGWCIIFAVKETVSVLGWVGFLWLLSGGVAYTIGAVLYGIGKKKRYVHFVFHLFVLIGTACQAVSIFGYVLLR